MSLVLVVVVLFFFLFLHGAGNMRHLIGIVPRKFELGYTRFSYVLVKHEV